MPSTSHKPGAPFLAHFARSGILQLSTVPATARVKQTLLSVAFDLDFDFDLERAPGAPISRALSEKWDSTTLNLLGFQSPPRTTAANTTVEERRFSAA
jgi:hypothetical protein